MGHEVPCAVRSLHQPALVGLAVLRAGDVLQLPVKQSATFTVVPGLADANCSSFRDSAGRYLRHWDFRVRFDCQKPDAHSGRRGGRPVTRM